MQEYRPSDATHIKKDFAALKKMYVLKILFLFLFYQG